MGAGRVKSDRGRFDSRPGFSSNGKGSVFRAPVALNHLQISPSLPSCGSSWVLHLPRLLSTTSKKSKNTATTPVCISLSISAVCLFPERVAGNWPNMWLGSCHSLGFPFLFFFSCTFEGIGIFRVSELMGFLLLTY